jgi:hypothetical protein
MSYRDDRRADRAADAEQARLDADAATERRIRERDAIARQNRTDDAARVEQALTAASARNAEKTARSAARRTTRAARLAALRTFAAAHLVDLLIYPLAVASAVMAVPSMAAFGAQSYGNATGAVLPILSELGMWAFALATMVSRRQHPDRPVWALQLGTWTFAAAALGLNVLHGLDRGLSAAVVMGVASVAGVIAHQLLTASPRRSAVERAEAAIGRRAARKTERVRRAAVRHAVAEIDTAGNATLVYAPGRFVLAKRGRLEAAIVPGLPVDPADPIAELLATEATAWLATQDRPDLDSGPVDLEDRGPVATLDHGSDRRKSTPDRSKVRDRTTRTIAQLRADFAAALADDATGIDPTSAESIRKALKCSPARARQLRDEHRPK